MASVNKVILIGNLTRDPEMKYTPKGSAVTDIGLAVNRTYQTEGGEKREETTFVDVTFWGRSAEIISKYLQKGRPVYVEGRLQMDTWEDKQSGQKRSRLKVVGESFQFLGGGREGGAAAPRSDYEDEPASRPRSAPGAPSKPDEDDDIPF